jgi:molybdenum cofactor cytidylyltransferase
MRPRGTCQMIVAVILAAGASRRMGRPKALLEYRGKTFMQSILATLRAAAIDSAVVAISPLDDKIKHFIDLTFASIVYNQDTAETGPISSIKAALLELINHQVEYVLVWPVDQPHVAVQTVASLKSVSLQKKPDIAVPVFNGVRGHPVLFRQTVFQELLSAPADLGARSVVRRLPDRVLEIPVQDPAVIDDIDTPEDYQRLISSTKSLL